MGKRKAKKISPSKSPKPPEPPPPAQSPPPPLVPGSEIEIVALSPASEEVSDAHLSLPADMVAQPAQDSTDLRSPPTNLPSAKTEIVKQLTDPSSGEKDVGNTLDELSPVASAEAPQLDKPHVELSTVAKSTCSSVSILATGEVEQTSTEALSTEVSASAEAKEVPLSSQQDANKVPPTGVTGELATSNLADAERNSPAAVDPPKMPAKPQEKAKDTWCDRAKGTKPLSKKGEAFILPSGEACVKIPNSVIEKNRKAWEPFVLGQFYSDPPSQGTLHNIVNGIWSKQYRDIAVSKMEGFSFLFRIPNAATRNRVINQKLWQIEGQTMFVDKWEPGIVPSKPELTSAPIWLELRKVPFQFFNEDGLERIAGLVGEPRFLHPATANKTNLEVAKVFTIIDPRKPLPEAVNVQFDSGVISRVLVSSPWMPPVCGFCKEIGHSLRRCPTAPKPCSICSSNDHTAAKCPNKKETRGRKTRRSRSRSKQMWVAVDSPVPDLNAVESAGLAEQAAPPQLQHPPPPGFTKEISKATSSFVEIVSQSKLGTAKDKTRGETSGSTPHKQLPRSASATSRSSQSDLQADSSDVESSDSELEEGEFSKHEPDFEVVRNRKRFSGQKGKRGKCPKTN